MRWKGKGSMTVEAVFVMSVLLLILAWLMKEAIVMYQQTRETLNADWIDIEKAAETFRMLFLAKEWM